MPVNRDQCQPQSSDHPASLFWQGSFKVKPENQVSRSGPGSGRYQTGHRHSCSTAAVGLRQGTSTTASAWKQLPRDGEAGRPLLRLPLAFFPTNNSDQQKGWPWTQSAKLLNQLKSWESSLRVLKQYRLGIHCPEGSVVEQNLGNLVDTKLNVSQQHALAVKICWSRSRYY